MSSVLSNTYLSLFSRVVLGVVFIIASIDKIVAPDAFAANVQAYELVPYALVNITALVIPWIELICGIFLLGGVRVQSCSAVLSALLLIFIIAMMTALVRELKIDCGCFGKEHASPVSWMRVLEDVGLFVLGAHLFFFATPPHLMDNVAAKS
ncbi:MAG: DoxX family membrane protein [Ignavibacteria bacterium]|nr:DoxX family membrane protein [Ignavibacteria bacterium]MBI3766518.1 DoxX family membrane protein [Ignavibacteriales bacterium]